MNDERDAGQYKTKEIPMKKRLVLLLMVLAMVLTFAPLAMADHCTTCRSGNCVPATLPAYHECVDLGSTCRLRYACGGPHPFVEEEELFGAELTVASVERLDNRMNERQPAPADEQPRVASLETPAPSER
jgi:hypothetical protein